MNAGTIEHIRAMQEGSETALESIIAAYLPLVKGIVCKVLLKSSTRETTEECISDVFFSIWNNKNKFAGNDEEAFRKWICAIAKYRAIDFYRKEGKRLDAPGREGDQLEFSAGQSCSAEDEIIFRENRREIEELLNLLTPQDRQIFIMKFFWGLKSDEISKQLGLSKSAVDNRIYRGKKQLAGMKMPMLAFEKGGI